MRTILGAAFMAARDLFFALSVAVAVYAAVTGNAGGAAMWAGTAALWLTTLLSTR